MTAEAELELDPRLWREIKKTRRSPPAVSDEMGVRSPGRPAAAFRSSDPGANIGSRRAARPRAAETHSAEAEATSTDTPGPMVEVREIFCM